jgi:hypothetical protein
MALDLQVIDDTFGKNADLYEDVLRVPTTATQEEIQLAYFDRRSELFTLLAKIDAAMKGPQSESSSSMADQRRYKAEKQMDSVVFAVRILADPTLRISYDEIRPDRVGVGVVLPAQAGGYTLQQTQSAVSTESSSVAISHTSSSVLSSTISSNNNDNNNSNNNNKRSSRKQQQQNQRDRTPPQQNQHASPPRTVTPTELPANISDTKSWIQSAFSGSLFSNDDDIEIDQEDSEGNVDAYNNNPTRKQKRRQQQQQPSSTSSSSDRPSAEYDHQEQQQQQEYPVEKEKEKKSLWGRKKRKKKKQSKDSNGISLNNNMNSNVTDTSMTDSEDIHNNNNSKHNNNNNGGGGDDNDNARSSSNSKLRGGGVFNTFKRSVSIQRSSTSHTEHTTGTEMTGTGGGGEDDSLLPHQQGEGDDDDARTFLDDDGETFASASVFSNADDEELHKNAATCGREQGMFGCITGSKTFRKISDEVSGACEDTLISVDQVFNAFTLTDKDIKAVTKKIHKAKKQLES